MKERPILFSAPVVRAILAGTKTQTRRVAKGDVEDVRPPEWYAKRRLVHRPTCQRAFCENVDDGELACGGFDCEPTGGCCRSPYGAPGDRLWVRETSIISPKRWTDDWPLVAKENRKTDDEGDVRAVQYLATTPNREGADDFGLKATPSIFMPRWASRLTLEVRSVRVERLQEISEDDAAAEGVDVSRSGAGTYTDDIPSARRAFANLWDSINAAAPWKSNPFVWVVAFRRVERDDARP